MVAVAPSLTDVASSLTLSILTLRASSVLAMLLRVALALTAGSDYALLFPTTPLVLHRACPNCSNAPPSITVFSALLFLLLPFAAPSHKFTIFRDHSLLRSCSE